MSSFTFSRDQQTILESRNENIIVSAQAGAGKTAVLVQRILDEMVRRRLGLDHFLIVTFTKKAANEMKKKIREALRLKMEEAEQEERVWLRRQWNQVAAAAIETLHAFCWEVISDHFTALHQDPGFRIMEEGETRTVQDRVLEDLLQAIYEGEDLSPERQKEILDFFRRYGFGKRRDSEDVKDLIRALYREANQAQDSGQWLEEQLAHMSQESYTEKTRDDYIQQVLQPIIQESQEEIREIRDLLGPETPEILQNFMEEELGRMEVALHVPETPRAFQDWLNLSPFTFLKFPTITVKKYGEEAVAQKDQIKALREQLKKYRFPALEERKLRLKQDSLQEETEEMAKDFAILKDLTLDFLDRYQREKRESRLLDFSDLEHRMLYLLDQEEILSSLKRQYQAIYFDEYQDANAMQDLIVERLAGPNNLFFVGDIKQSIYRFRQACPENFLKRYGRYSQEEQSQAFDLTENFRSEPEIGDFTNFIFTSLMTQKRGDVDYNSPGHRMKTARASQGLGRVTVTLLRDEREAEEEESTEGSSYLDDISSQAFFVAHRIQNYVRGRGIYQGQEPGHYKDCALLFRTKHRMFQFEQVLHRFGIPSFRDGRGGSTDAPELLLFLNLLKVIDHAQEELPLLSVLDSMVGGLKDEDLARLRIQWKEEKKEQEEEREEESFGHRIWATLLSFFPTASTESAEEDFPEDSAKRAEPKNSEEEKLAKFARRLADWRLLEKELPLHEFIHQVLEESGLYAFVAALPFGEERKENLHTVLRAAETYENHQGSDLSGFLAQFDQQTLKKDRKKSQGEELPTAQELSEEDDVVRLMTIHKSKGLQFKEVFLVETERLQQKGGGKPLLVTSSGYGPTLRINRDSEQAGRILSYEPLRMELASRELAQEDLSESVRVFYVAVTRAINGLHIVGSVKAKNLSSYLSEERELQAALDGGNSYLKWVFSILKTDRLSHWEKRGSLVGDFPTAGSGDFFAGLKPRNPFVLEIEEGDRYREISDQEEAQTTGESLATKLVHERASYRYPYRQATQQSLKKTVSQLSKQNETLEEGWKKWPELQAASSPVSEERRQPQFVTGDRSVSTAEFGSLMHRAIQLLPIRPYTAEELAQTLDYLRDRNQFTPRERRSLREDLLLAFFQSELGQEVIRHRDHVFREQAFTLRLSGEELGTGFPESAEDPMQVLYLDGQIDLFYEEEEGLVLVDFKTDHRVNPERYAQQLSYYAKALEQAFGKKVTAAYLFWLRAGKSSRVLLR